MKQQPLTSRYDFIYLFDVANGNPNGDPDEGNAPRQDPVTQKGFVSDVCLKRKVRNYVCEVKRGANGLPEPGYDIYVKERAILNQQHQRAYDALKLKAEQETPTSINRDLARDWMCQTFFDIRMFGAVMTTGVNCGQVRGPVQLQFASSIDKIVPLDQSVTRMAVTTEDESKSQSGANRTMGGKYIISYALYRTHGFINANLARQTGFGEDDLALLWQSLAMMFDLDRSAARGLMAPRALLVFKHDSMLGSAPAHRMFERLEVQSLSKTPEKFADYEICFDRKSIDKVLQSGESMSLENGVTLTRHF